jgi:hypothetical protein
VFSTERERQRFADWIGGRSNRTAVPNAVVEAVLKPIQTQLAGVIAGTSVLKGIFDRVSEIRFSVPITQPPWVVSLLILTEEGDSLDVEEEAELLGWLQDALVGESVTAIEAAVRSLTTVSAFDYLATACHSRQACRIARFSGQTASSKVGTHNTDAWSPYERRPIVSFK